MSSNLPPGVSDHDLPGNRPEDIAWDKLLDDIADSGLTAEEARRRWESQPALLKACEGALAEFVTLRARLTGMYAKNADAAIAYLEGVIAGAQPRR